MNEFLKCYFGSSQFGSLTTMVSNYFRKSKNAYGKMPLGWSQRFIAFLSIIFFLEIRIVWVWILKRNSIAIVINVFAFIY